MKATIFTQSRSLLVFNLIFHMFLESIEKAENKVLAYYCAVVIICSKPRRKSFLNGLFHWYHSSYFGQLQAAQLSEYHYFHAATICHTLKTNRTKCHKYGILRFTLHVTFFNLHQDWVTVPQTQHSRDLATTLSVVHLTKSLN